MNKLLVAVALVGCTNSSGGTKADNSSGTPPAGQAEAAAALDPDAALGAKLEAYIECANEFVNDVHQARRNYLGDVNPKTGPTGKEEGKIYLAPQLHDPKKCVEGMAAAAKAEPHLPDLESAGAAFGSALAALYPLSEDGFKYYDREDNRDDKGAKGRALHVKLLAAWADFDKAVAALDPALETYGDKLDEARLAKLAKRPDQRLRYLHAKLMNASKKVVTVAASVDQPSALPLDAFHANVAALASAVDELGTYATAHKQEVDDLFMNPLIRGADTFLKSAKNLERRKRDKVAYSDGERATIGANNAAAVDGSPGQVIDTYNQLIGESNGLRWR